MKKEMTIEEFKTVAKDILIEIHEFCEKENIEYFLCYGTLLGSIRHNGFIPWDDDIDIAMPRESFERFIKSFKSNNRYLKLVSADNEPEYYLPFPKVVDSRTIVKEEVNSSFTSGVWVDIFPIDKYGEDLKDKIYLTIRNIFGKILLLKNLKVSERRGGYKNLIVGCSHLLLYPLTSNYISRKINELARKIDERNSTSEIGGVLTDYNFGESWTLELESLKPFGLGKFEGHFYYIPRDSDSVLKKLYGDYMKLPPENKRVTHHTFKAYWK